MELGDYLAIVRKHWVAILLVAVLGGIAALGYAKSQTPSYRAGSSVYVTGAQGENVGEAVQGTTYAQNQIESYAQLATKPFVLDPVIEDLDLDTTARSLARSVTVTRPVNSFILEIWATDTRPERAADIANAVAEELSRAVAALESESGGRAAVEITVVATAVPPSFAYTPNTKLLTATGLAAGLALGVVLALARTVLDTRIRSAKDLRTVTSAAVLTTVRHDRRAARQRVIMRSDPLGDQAEAYRRLRTNLRFLNLHGPSRSIMVTSAVPTEGKSTTALNLAVAMAEGSSRILLVDADLRRPSLARYLGVEGAVGLTTALIGEADVEDVIQPWGGVIDVLPAGQIPPNPSELLDSDAMAALLERLSASYDTVLLDAAPLLPVTDSAALSRYVSGTLVVVGCQVVRRHQVEDALASLTAVGARVLGLVLNQVPAKEAGATYVYGSAPRSNRRSLRFLRRRRRPGAEPESAAVPPTSVADIFGEPAWLAHEDVERRPGVVFTPVGDDAASGGAAARTADARAAQTHEVAMPPVDAHGAGAAAGPASGAAGGAAGGAGGAQEPGRADAAGADDAVRPVAPADEPRRGDAAPTGAGSPDDALPSKDVALQNGAAPSNGAASPDGGVSPDGAASPSSAAPSNGARPSNGAALRNGAAPPNPAALPHGAAVPNGGALTTGAAPSNAPAAASPSDRRGPVGERTSAAGPGAVASPLGAASSTSALLVETRQLPVVGPRAPAPPTTVPALQQPVLAPTVLRPFLAMPPATSAASRADAAPAALGFHAPFAPSARPAGPTPEAAPTDHTGSTVPTAGTASGAAPGAGSGTTVRPQPAGPTTAATSPRQPARQDAGRPAGDPGDGPGRPELPFPAGR